MKTLCTAKSCVRLWPNYTFWALTLVVIQFSKHYSMRKVQSSFDAKVLKGLSPER